MSANNPERTDKTEGGPQNIAVGSDQQQGTAVNHTHKTSLFEVYTKSRNPACFSSG